MGENKNDKRDKRKKEPTNSSFTNKKRRPNRQLAKSNDDDSSDDDLDDQIFEEFLKQLDKNNIVYNIEFDKENDDDLDDYKKYLKKLGKKKKENLEKLEKKIMNMNKTDIPLRYKILESDLEDKVKAQLLQKAIHFESLSPINGEYFKLKKYMDGILKIPFKKIIDMPVRRGDRKEKIKTFMYKLKYNLDNCIYSQENAKQSIMQIIAKWITNPRGTGNIIGLHGPPGIGKTSLVKGGLSKSVGLPFSFISLGGSTHSSTLEGFDYTYEGSKWGRIVDILMENKCMNPIIFFDELDKISQTKEGEEIASILMQLTDPTQNNCFSDKYFSGIDFDLSKAFIIFSFNDINKIHPVLKDRITIIEMGGFKVEEKITIGNKFSLKKICKNIGIDIDKIKIPEDTMRAIINTYCPEKGIRKLEKCLETLLMKVNLYDITRDLKNLSIREDVKISEPYIIDAPTALKLLDPTYRKDDMNMAVKMMYS